jgi:tRNA (guanine-N7-)-methyltransferase
MRLRADQNAKDKLLKEKGLVSFFEKEDAHNLLPLVKSPGPIALEIGCGKGGFVIKQAKHHPEFFYFALEKIETILVKALRKYHRDPVPNVHYVRADAHQLTALFSPSSLSRLYLNFSDPWPKSRHEKRRLTHPSLLKVYRSLLAPSGEIHLKTDNRSLFFYSLVTLQAHGFEIQSFTLDLYQDPKDNIPTEFEEKFRDQMPIHRLIAVKR